MAASDNTRNPISLSPPNNQIAKGIPEPDNTVPLSPQWLLPKPGDSKTRILQGDNHSSPFIGYGDRSDVIKSPGNGEQMHESQKKKDVFRPTILDAESGRRNRWRDEERDTNLSARKDRRREGEKEIGDVRKTERRVENLSTRHFGESRRPSSDRWADSSRENSYDQRRETKWNPRWGPDDKEVDKWTDGGKHVDTPHDKGLSYVVSHGKDEKEGDHHRPWRPSSLQGRAKAEPPHLQSQTSSKEGPAFGHGRGRSENAPTFSVGRGRVNHGSGSASNYFNNSHSVLHSDRGDQGEPSPFRYSRTKLLDVYRLTDIRSSNKILDGLIQVSSLTQEEPLEPLALCAPTPEESGILKGIEKGEVVSSGVTQISKDGPTGRSSNDGSQTRRIKHGSRDDVSLLPDDNNDKVDHFEGTNSKLSDGLPHEKQMHTYDSDIPIHRDETHVMYGENKFKAPGARDDEYASKRDVEVFDSTDCGIQARVHPQSSTPWRSHSVEQLANSHSRDWLHSPNDIRSRNSDGPWSQEPKDNSKEWGNVLPDSSYGHKELNWQIGENAAVTKYPAAVDREQESRKLLHSSPEDLLLYYKDPQGQIQGPFTGSDIIGWFEAGYFGIDLQVRLVNAPNDSPFSLLGDVMPHLRAKARPPPGFNAAKQSEVPDVFNRSALTSFGKVLPSPSGIALLGNEDRHIHGSSTEAENRFIESLMSGDVNSSLERFAASGGLQGYAAQTSVPPLGTESGEALNLLAQRINLEQQKSLTHPYSYWPTRDAGPVVPSPDITRNANMPQANLLSTGGDMSRQSLSQNAEMMSILQGLSDRSSGGINNGLGSWSNMSLQGGIDLFKDNKVNLHHGQNFPPQVAYGLQQHKLQPQNPPPLTNILAQQTLENPNMLPDRILTSGLAQDPQALNLLQQQLLLQQLQSQQSAPGLQLSLLDKILLIKQQQKQEEQQQLIRQQQQLLSQVLSEQQLAQRFGDPAFGHLQASAPLVGNTPIDQPAPQPSPSVFQINSQTSVSGIPDDRISSIANTPVKVHPELGHTVPPGLGHTVPTEGSSLQLPHQMLGLQQNFPSLSTHADILKNNNLSSLTEMMEKVTTSLDRPPSAVAVEKSSYESSVASSARQALPSSVVDSVQCELSADSVTLELPESSVANSSVDHRDNEVMFERTSDTKHTHTAALQETSIKECHEDVVAAKKASNVESREVKKTSDKRSRKAKSSKAQPSPEQVKGASKESTQKSKQSTEGALVEKSEEVVFAEATSDQMLMETTREISPPPESDLSNSPTLQSDAITQQSVQSNSAQRAWKPAVCVKPKSLLEIQQEEQKKAQMEIPASFISSSISPLSPATSSAGVVAHTEPQVPKEIHQEGGISEHKTEFPKSKRSGLHDLLAAEVLAKSSNRSIEVDNASSLPPLPSMSNQQDDVDDENFIEAKDTKKSRKKAAKAKAAGAKNSTAVSSDVVVASSPVEKGKSSKHVQAAQEVLPAPPSGPSLGDFVPWKGESTSPSPAPAWSTDSGKFPKPTSLRDILKEQEKKVTSAQQHSPVPTPQKSQSSQARVASWSVSALSPSKAASPVQTHSQLSSQSKSKGEDDLFWGPPDQNKQETKQGVFPQLGNQGNWASKSTPSKATPAASLNRQKSTGGRAVENYVLSSPASAQASVKGKRDGSTKHLEAMDFRDWCESESVRLTGSRDTSFLAYCLKQSRSEAQMLLIENLGSFDPNHEFIEKFLNYMEMLSADVLELAFQIRNDTRAAYNNGPKDMNPDNGGSGEVEKDADGSSKGGKKKGKKGKKVSPSVLGFNVVSNRIMKGEIQTVED